jgi:hypothetical protein
MTCLVEAAPEVKVVAGKDYVVGVHVIKSLSRCRSANPRVSVRERQDYRPLESRRVVHRPCGHISPRSTGRKGRIGVLGYHLLDS